MLNIISFLNYKNNKVYILKNNLYILTNFYNCNYKLLLITGFFMNNRISEDFFFIKNLDFFPFNKFNKVLLLIKLTNLKKRLVMNPSINLFSEANLLKNINIFIKIYEKKNFIFFLKYFKHVFNQIFFLYYFDFWLIGLGFKLRHLVKSRKLFRMVLRYSCFRYIFNLKKKFDKIIIIKRFTTKLLIVSPYLWLLHNFIIAILFFRAIRPYQWYGVFGPKARFLILKEGKIR